eukprot:CAMPEP_0169408372 /NCGR_PEP_ID=MMETSP1017-20121227/58660_1 /TAXON_ID=342587 /ORGANISM="Karlodinium micrum, Strain CCMP2283" /LENGTH=331 /DNA_ID=CAMNT_0009515461 /DNA_START=22 /DNA_END=1014 /DNA_ORIENTATION=-
MASMSMSETVGFTKKSVRDKSVKERRHSSATLLEFDDDYLPEAHGIKVPGHILHEVYLTRADLEPLVEWETGRKSEPAFMDMNIHAVCGDSTPKIVLYQHDEGDPMNPRGLLVAYAEKTVKPVVSDFDAFLVASTGMHYEPLPAEQAELAKWTLQGAREILKDPTADGWTSRWLSHLKEENARGFHPVAPKHGFGDPTSCGLIANVVEQTSLCGAIRHGAECFNFYFPQELDDEYLVVWSGFEQTPPWAYMQEPELREFLIERVKEGFSFPVNPVWPVRDPGWYKVLTALRNAEWAQDNLKSWFPEEQNILQVIDEIHNEFPNGYVPLNEE